jgi:hypothetical protein
MVLHQLKLDFVVALYFKMKKKPYFTEDKDGDKERGFRIPNRLKLNLAKMKNYLTSINSK